MRVAKGLTRIILQAEVESFFFCLREEVESLVLPCRGKVLCRGWRPNRWGGAGMSPPSPRMD
jgi:hypothetical protein